MKQVLLQIHKRNMAIAGLFMAVFLVLHMLATLTFIDDSQFNRFFEAYLNSPVRWLVLAGLLIALWVHIKAAIRIRVVNAKARTVQYQRHDHFHVPAWLVTLSIAFLLLFIITHIIQMLYFDTTQIYQQVVSLFESVWMTLFYLAASLIMFMHLQHSLANVLQTLGWRTDVRFAIKYGISIVSVLGLAWIPLYIWLGMA